MKEQELILGQSFLWPNITKITKQMLSTENRQNFAAGKFKGQILVAFAFYHRAVRPAEPELK
ncbi:hypothetical protein BpHYR1_017932 [Brachionus plicatilis]|uniref:Uncharacterized protein n=1 Tax=Brachionus plicatilis TaxID=10195 RepID=A0A3M7SX06_BRAPC|nr:hypothetical protein BpHYR1_017932 [Brachionus plicatilis]